jgi:hypothetical protein
MRKSLSDLEETLSFRQESFPLKDYTLSTKQVVSYEKLLQAPVFLGFKNKKSDSDDRLYKSGEKVYFGGDSEPLRKEDSLLIQEILTYSSTAKVHWNKIHNLLVEYQEVARQREDVPPLLVVIQLQYKNNSSLSRTHASMEYPRVRKDPESGLPQMILPVFVDINSIKGSRVSLETVLTNELTDIRYTLELAKFFTEKGIDPVFAFFLAQNTNSCAESVMLAIDTVAKDWIDSRLGDVSTFSLREIQEKRRELLKNLSPEQVTDLLKELNTLGEKLYNIYAERRSRFYLQGLTNEGGVVSYERTVVDNAEARLKGTASLPQGVSGVISIVNGEAFVKNPRLFLRSIVKEQLRLYGLSSYIDIDFSAPDLVDEVMMFPRFIPSNMTSPKPPQLRRDHVSE